MSPKAVIRTKNLTPKTLLHPDRTVTNCGSECKISCHSILLFQKIMFLISDDFCISWINLDSELFKICELLSLGTIVSKLHKKDQKVLFSSIANVSNKSDQKFRGLGQECFSCFKCHSVAGPIVVHNARAKSQKRGSKF